MGDRIKENQGIIIAIVLWVIVGIVTIFLVRFLCEKYYEYNCDNTPITQAWQDDKCVEYFRRSIGD
jgi:hypothetical protein